MTVKSCSVCLCLQWRGFRMDDTAGKLDFFPPILELQMQDRSTDGQKAMARTANSKRNRHSDSTTRQFSSSATLTFDLMTQIDTPGRLKMSLRVPNLLMHSIYLFLHHRAEIRTDKRTDGRMGLSLYPRFAPWTSVITVASVIFQITPDKHSLRPCYRGV